jgi:hypothetical protein
MTGRRISNTKKATSQPLTSVQKSRLRRVAQMLLSAYENERVALRERDAVARILVDLKVMTVAPHLPFFRARSVRQVHSSRKAKKSGRRYGVLTPSGRHLVNKHLGEIRTRLPALSVAKLDRALRGGDDRFDGRCGSFALALAECLGPDASLVVSLSIPEIKKWGRWAGHVAVLWSGRLWDSRGQITFELLEAWAIDDPRKYEDRRPKHRLPRLGHVGFGTGTEMHPDLVRVGIATSSDVHRAFVKPLPAIHSARVYVLDRICRVHRRPELVDQMTAALEATARRVDAT